MKLRLTALLLVLILVSTIMVSAFATETTAPVPGETAPETTVDPAAEPAAETTEEPAEEAAPDSAEEILAEEPVIEVPEASRNAIMFVDLADMVKKNSPSYKALRANASAIDDAADQVDKLNDALVQISAGLKEIDAQIAASIRGEG